MHRLQSCCCVLCLDTMMLQVSMLYTTYQVAALLMADPAVLLGILTIGMSKYPKLPLPLEGFGPTHVTRVHNPDTSVGSAVL